MKIGATPLNEQRRQLVMLVILGLVLVSVIYYYYGEDLFGPGGGATETSNLSTSAAARVGASGPLSLPSALKLAALEPVNDTPATGRNPFRFGVPPAPPTPPRPITPSAPPVPQGPPPPPPGPPLPPPISLKFVGVVQLPSGKKIASLNDGKGIMMGGEGDVIDGRFRIVRIGVESIVMEYLDGRGRQTIPLRGTGTEPQAHEP